MCTGRKLRRVICKCCHSTITRYEVIGIWDVFKKGYRCKGGNRKCDIFDYKDEIESRHRCASCLAKTMLGIHGSHSSHSEMGSTTKTYATVYGFGNGYGTGNAFGDNQIWYTGNSGAGGSTSGSMNGGDDGDRRLRYSSDASFA